MYFWQWQWFRNFLVPFSQSSVRASLLKQFAIPLLDGVVDMDDSNDNLFIAGWQEPYQLTRGALCHFNKPITLSPHSGAGQRSWQDKAFTTRRLSAGCLFWTYLTLNGRILNISFLPKRDPFYARDDSLFRFFGRKINMGCFLVWRKLPKRIARRVFPQQQGIWVMFGHP